MTASSFPILVIAPPTVSEAIVFSGVVKRLVDEIPHARFTVVGEAAAASVFADLPSVEKLLPLSRPPSGFESLRLWARLRRRRWGLVLDLAGGRLGRSMKARRRALRKPLPKGIGPMHKVLEGARILRIDDDPPAPYLFTSPATEAAAEALLRPERAGVEGPILAVAPAADWVGKAWPGERFAVVAAELLRPTGPLAGGRLMIVGSSEDRWATEPVRRAIARERLIDLSGRADLPTIYACLKRARLFIGGDNPMTQLAAASGAPTLALFGPSDERVWGPWGPRAETLRGPRSYEAIKAVDPGLNQAVCHMQDLPVAWVVNAARRLIEETQPGTPASEEPSDA